MQTHFSRITTDFIDPNTTYVLFPSVLFFMFARASAKPTKPTQNKTALLLNLPPVIRRAYKACEPEPSGKERTLPPFMQAVAIQFVLFRHCLNDKTNIRDLTLAARAWEVLERLKRDIRMKPKPRDVDVSMIRAKTVAAFDDPAEPAVAQVLTVKEVQEFDPESEGLELQTDPETMLNTTGGGVAPVQ